MGLAFGVSTLCIADALHRNGRGSRLISIDSDQNGELAARGRRPLRKRGNDTRRFDHYERF